MGSVLGWCSKLKAFATDVYDRTERREEDELDPAGSLVMDTEDGHRSHHRYSGGSHFD